MNAVFEIGPFRLDPEAGALTHAGRPVGLGPRAVAVLSVLVERANEYVTKASLIDAAWPNVVVEEANLAVQISAIRRVLAQAPGGEHWVETLARRGYRFVGPVTLLMDNRKPRVGSERPRSNLPAPLTSFVGRERELVDTKRLLSRCRLLTLVGIGGIGKTRLALQAAAEVVDAYRDGVWYVDLAPRADVALVSSAAAQVLGVREAAGTPLLQALCDHVKGRQLLLLLDNCEHLLTGCTALADALLCSAAELSIIATSREPLHVSGEQTYPLPALSLPNPMAIAESMHRSEAVQLFLERAEKQQPGFALTDARASTVAQLCIHLDGIPLALELAAARVRSLSIEEINARLTDRFKLLTGGIRTALPRQQTLRSSIDWSYDLLRESEQALLCRVSVFAGGWTIAAAEQVCIGDGIDEGAVLDLLSSLADKSLVMTEERNGATRFRLLETMRQYAGERLREHGEDAHWRKRHFAYFLAVVLEAETHLRGADEQAWLDRLEVEHDNLRSALAWSSGAGGDAAGGLRLAGAFWRFWLLRGYLSEGRGWLSDLLAIAAGGEDPAARAKALNGAGVLACQQADFPTARILHEEGLAIRRKLGDRRGIAVSLHNLGLVACDQGDYPSARALHEESLAVFRELGERPGIAHSLNNQGDVAYHQGDYDFARTLYEESQAIHRELGDKWGIGITMHNLANVVFQQGDCLRGQALHEESLAIRRELGDRGGVAQSLNSLGTLARDRGDFPSAKAFFEKSEAILREMGDRWSIAATLHHLGTIAVDQGDPLSARALYMESLSIRREVNDRRGIACSLEGLADVAVAFDESIRAARMWGAAEQLRMEIGAPVQPSECNHYQRQVAAARRAIGDDAAFELAWQVGRAMTLDQAVKYALAGKDA